MKQQEIDNLVQGDIRALFPNLGMTVYSNGCKCEIVAVTVCAGAPNSGTVTMEVIENYNKMYKVGAKITDASFLIEKP